MGEALAVGLDVLILGIGHCALSKRQVEREPVVQHDHALRGRCCHDTVSKEAGSDLVVRHFAAPFGCAPEL